jgi:nitrogen regulatory protein PII
MRFKLIVAMVEDDKTDLTLDTARAKGATGCTVITNARGEGLTPQKTFLGLSVSGHRDVVLLLVEEHMSRHILEAIGKACEFEEKPGTGVAFQIDIEDAIGLRSQIKKIEEEIDEGDL